MPNECPLFGNDASRRGVTSHKLRLRGSRYLAVLLSCYPVVFFGKSFVSPNNGGVILLYDTFPTLPGYTSTSLDDAKGADVGAIMWAAHAVFSC